MSRRQQQHMGGSGCGTSGALFELTNDIYFCRKNGAEYGGAVFDSGVHNQQQHHHHHTSPKHADPNNNFYDSGAGVPGSRRATTALQSRIIETIARTPQNIIAYDNLVRSSRRWFAAVFRASSVWVDDHPTTPTRRGFVAIPHDVFDMKLLSAPSDLQIIPNAISTTNTTIDSSSSVASAANTAKNASPSPQRPNNNNNQKNQQQQPSAAATTAGGKSNTASPAATNNLSTSKPMNPAELLRRLMLRSQEVASCQWSDGGGTRLRAVLDRPVESLAKELNFRALVNEDILNPQRNKNNNNSNNNGDNNDNSNNLNNYSPAGSHHNISTMGGVGEFFEGLVLANIEDESGGVWTRVSPLPYQVSYDGLISGGECHGFGLESVAPSWHNENRYMASQFSEPNSLMVSRTPTEVVVALPWGERERVYGMLFLPPHIDDRYARLLAWDIFVSARVAFGESIMCQPSKKEIKNLVKASTKNGFDSVTPSKEIVKKLGRIRAKVIPEAVQTILALRRRYSPCPILPLCLSPLSPARNDVAVERIVLEVCAYIYRAVGCADFAIFHDHRVLYSNVSLAVTGIMQNVHHLLRTQAMDSGNHLSSELPGWSGSDDIDHVNDCVTLIAPVSWPPGQCLTQLCVEGTPQNAEKQHRFCSLWTVGHNNFASSSIEVVFMLPQTPVQPTSSSSSAEFTTQQQNLQQNQQQPHHHAASFYEFAWNKKEPTLLWEIHDTLYPLFVLTERLNDSLLFCQKRAFSPSAAGVAGFDGSILNSGGSVGLPVSTSPDGSTNNVNSTRNVTFEIHKLGYAQTFSTVRGIGPGGHQLQPYQQQQLNSVPGYGGGGAGGGGGKSRDGSPKGINNNNAGAGGGQHGYSNSNNTNNLNAPPPASSMAPNIAGGTGAVTGAGAAAAQQQQPAFVLNENVDPDCFELDRVTRLAASFSFSHLRPSRELWCSGGSSYSGLFSADAQRHQSCVRLRPAATAGVVLTSVAGADCTQFTLSENRNTYCFPL